MKFYDVDEALKEAISAADKPVKVRVEIDCGNGFFHRVLEQDIIEANFWGLKEAAGGTSARGELLLDNFHGVYSFHSASSGSQVRVSFSLGDGLPYFQRFVFYIDEKGIQDIKGNGRKRTVYTGLQDLSARLRKTEEARDWTAPAVFTYSVVCDKTQPEKSLVHGIAGRAGLSANDIDCSTIPVTLPFARLRRNIWAELSSLATAYRCHLECAPEKPLVFAHSPYQKEELKIKNEESFDNLFTFRGEDIFYFRKTERTDYYRNTVRLKVNMPVSLERQEIWHYDEPPVFFDDNFIPYYPFKSPLEREIEVGKYEAKYKVIEANSTQGVGRERNVVFADEIDTQEEAERRIEYVTNEKLKEKNEKSIGYSHYDVTTNFDKASLTLQRKADVDLFNASIHGRPIVLDLNRSSFVRDDEAVANFGTVALNVTGSYFSEHDIDGRPQYEDWVIRELGERVQRAGEFTVKTHRALFHARVGAKVKIKIKNEELSGTINRFSFRYKRERAFVASFRIFENREGKNESTDRRNGK